MKGSPAKLGTIRGTSGYKSAVKQKQQSSGGNKLTPKQTSKESKYMQLKEWLITERGFNQADADRMIESGAYSFEDIKKESINKGRPNTKDKSPAKQKTYPPSYTKEDIEFLKKQREDIVRYEDLDEKGKAIWRKLREEAKKKREVSKEKKSGPKVKQEDWEPAYEGADYSKEEIAKMTEQEKIDKIDGYEPKNKKPKNKK